ncbi:ABC transporter substrate-binding protein [Stackebrandtia nassauensis]|uniref:Extracellular solute-binding protein family 1 n=1 Tax=Stackebrandtia nassauensis (strain DSM 44728 / CIP 108903 / NRRL B-16338 / NBRC 102104 / LLR-40K-21) TaxID=446470 RepID=D3QAK9_STANL|nr:sugar ABC transporter substrate-binding protein [Stackebrandtia nassauensis]ADD42792.1 extracellular solute-binding protein family 1 [Stackebrandtia nassauensis DSM 44728]
MSPGFGESRLSRRGLLRASALGLGALGAGSLTACAGSNPDELVFWHFVGPSSPQGKWQTTMVDDWNKHNKVRITERFVPFGDYASGPTLQTSFSADSGPDIFLLSPGDFLRYHNAGVLMDLTPYLPQSVRDDYLPGTLDSRSFDGKVYGLPIESEPLALFYSHDAFEKAGLSEADVPANWDQMLDVADKLTTDRRFGLLFETNPGYYQNFTWYPFLWQGGGSPVSKDQKSGRFDSKATVDALALWQDSINRRVAPTLPQGSGGMDTISNLGNGYCAMQQTGVWGVGELGIQLPDFKFGVAPLPKPPGGKDITTAGGWALVANVRGRNPEAAAEFIAWALGSDEDDCVERGRQLNTVIKKNLPVRRSVRDLAEKSGDIDTDNYRKFVEEIAPIAVGEPRYPVEIYRSISDAIQACQLDGADPATVAADTDEQIQTFVSTYEGASIL